MMRRLIAWLIVRYAEGAASLGKSLKHKESARAAYEEEHFVRLAVGKDERLAQRRYAKAKARSDPLAGLTHGFDELQRLAGGDGDDDGGFGGDSDDGGGKGKGARKGGRGSAWDDEDIPSDDDEFGMMMLMMSRYLMSL